ncbi:MAG: ribonuclease P protein component [bacterium]|nr:ribonuclease P protein component [bacterium]
MLAKKFRLSSRRDIEKVLKKGRILKTDHFSMRFLLNNLVSSRLGFIVSAKAARQAVGRNLLKRRAREIIRKKIKNFKKGYDVLFIFFKSASALSFSELGDSIGKALVASGIL